MRSKVFVASDWQTVVGTVSVDLPFTGPRRVDVDFVTAGANVFLETEGEDGECHRLLMFSGFGSGSVSFFAEGPVAVRIEQDDTSYTSLHIPELRSMSAEWMRTASYADVEPKRPFAISPEMQQAIDLMNRNAVAREMKLLKALEARLK